MCMNVEQMFNFLIAIDLIFKIIYVYEVMLKFLRTFYCLNISVDEIPIDTHRDIVRKFLKGGPTSRLPCYS